MKTILAAVDFSPVTKRVFAEAAALAHAAQARLILLNVTNPASLVADYASLEALLESAESGTSPAASPSGIHGDSLQVIGKPIDVILEQAAQCDASYIVMGSHGHTALFELMVGGTAAGVIRGAPCPVMVIPSVTRKGQKWRGKGFRRKDPVAWLQRTGVRTAERIRFPAERNGCEPKDKTSEARTLIATKLPA
jgi:nucleotide-binding universal stress UspA family protein